MFGLGSVEIFVIAIVVLLLFGAKRLPEIGKGLGGAIREFRNIKKEIKDKPEKSDREMASKRDKGVTERLENKVVESVIQSVPGVQGVVRAKQKIDKVSEIIRK